MCHHANQILYTPTTLATYSVYSLQPSLNTWDLTNFSRNAQTFATMCCIYIHGYEHCDCIYTRNEVDTCVDFLDAHVNNENKVFTAKFLTFTSKNLDKEIDGVDYVSSEKVDLSRPNVPKGFTCRNLEVGHESQHTACPLCGNAKVLKTLREMNVERNVASSYGSRGTRDIETYDAKKNLEHCWSRWCT